MTTSKPGIAERTQMMLDNLDQCEMHARRIWRLVNKRLPFDDLLQEGRLALWMATERFDTGRGVTFRSFADRSVRGRMLDSVRRWNHSRCLIPPVHVELADVHVAPDSQPACEAALDIEHLAAQLTPKQRRGVAEHFAMTAGLVSIRELGERRGITEAGEQHRLGETRRLLAKALRRKRAT